MPRANNKHVSTVELKRLQHVYGSGASAFVSVNWKLQFSIRLSHTFIVYV